MGDEAMDITSVPDDPTLGLGTSAHDGRAAHVAGQPADDLRRDRRLRRRQPQRLPEGFDRIIRDNSGYYVLGYYSTNRQKRDGRFRKLEVRASGPA